MDGERAATLARALAGFDLVYLTGVSLAILEPEARERLFDLLEGLGPDTRLGFDPNQLTYFYRGLDQKLVGVEGAEPIKQII